MYYKNNTLSGTKVDTPLDPSGLYYVGPGSGVPNPFEKPPAKPGADNTLWWVLGIGLIAAVALSK